MPQPTIVSRASAFGSTGQSKGASRVTYQAQYTYRSKGKEATVTVAQSPPKYFFKYGTSGYALYTGKATYGCSATVCVSYATEAPIAATLGIFNGTLFQDSVHGYAVTALKEPDSSVSFGSSTVAGLHSNCVTVDMRVKMFTWCVAQSNGILTSSSTSSWSFRLTSFTTSPSRSDFKVPTGVKIVAVP